jgi:L-asparaginase / beta-aspartyl-peptidase
MKEIIFMSIAIIVHGGAGSLAPERREIVQAGCKEAVLAGWHILQDGGSALDAVEAVVRTLEDNPEYNAGTGSSLNVEGNIEMDAGMMEGDTLRVGAIAGVASIKNPILLARLVLESPHVLLIGRGAEEFALEQGMSFCTREELLTQRQHEIWQKMRTEHMARKQEPSYHRREIGALAAHDVPKRTPSIVPPQELEEKHGTVGAAAVDAHGRLAAATSTGGTHYKYPGRVGDSPLVGCGFYADEHAAVSCTGHGEDFIRLLIAKRAADCVARGMSARDAAEATIAVLSAKATGEGGLIIVDHLGNVGFAWNSPHMSHAYIIDGMTEPITGV